jgi:hypothetical protein
LFPHQCERQTPVGCPDCNNGQISDPYASRTDRRGYTDDYDSDGFSWDDSGTGVAAAAFGGGDAGGGGASMDFTEADGASLVNADEGFEDDLSAS